MSNIKILGSLAPPSDAHAPKIFSDKKAEENNKKMFTNKHLMIFENNIHWYLFFVLIFEPDTKSTEHQHTLSAQQILTSIDTERFVSVLVSGPQDYRHLFANSQHSVQHYIQSTRVGHENRMLRNRVQTWPMPGEVRMRCGLHTSSNQHWNVLAFSHKAKCDYSVQRVSMNINSLTASKHTLLDFLHLSRNR